jgi:hypothetical protein
MTDLLAKKGVGRLDPTRLDPRVYSGQIESLTGPWMSVAAIPYEEKEKTLRLRFAGRRTVYGK